jgi:hypothetical protein
MMRPLGGISNPAAVNANGGSKGAKEEELVNQTVAIHDEHCIQVQRIPLDGPQVVGLIGVCTCGWRSGTHQIYAGASTNWAEQRARHSIERARDAHLQSLLV